MIQILTWLRLAAIRASSVFKVWIICLSVCFSKQILTWFLFNFTILIYLSDYLVLTQIKSPVCVSVHTMLTIQYLRWQLHPVRHLAKANVSYKRALLSHCCNFALVAIEPQKDVTFTRFYFIHQEFNQSCRFRVGVYCFFLYLYSGGTTQQRFVWGITIRVETAWISTHDDVIVMITGQVLHMQQIHHNDVNLVKNDTIHNHPWLLRS